ncbi:MAG: GTP 3',8-cyclase MoaA [Saccharospirillaceae bacterium]|nr:GTP 3',8-cyclase MoaA [Pseudomonadales bacterium]NRB78772.1 GTP 3',8-cyclase MoaA [Saccharospirillaceae bacterium]
MTVQFKAPGLTDPQGRQFRYVRLSITDVCNFKCDYCLPDGYKKSADTSFLTLDEIQKSASALAKLGVQKIRITGGEPVLRKDHVEIIKLLKNTPGIKEVTMTTNGYKINKYIKQWKDAGLDALTVSIDSLHPSTFQKITGHSILDEILNGLEQAVLLGFKAIKVNVVLMQSFNANEFLHFINWVKDKPITLRFIELMQTGDNKKFFDKEHVRADNLIAQLTSLGWQSIKKSITAGPATEYEHKDSKGNIGFITPYSDDFCKTCNRLRISAKGKLHLCLFGDGGFDLRPFMQSSVKQDELIKQLQNQLGYKKDSHFLQNGNTGSTKHLAMIGG